jgi:hypothetical protein
MLANRGFLCRSAHNPDGRKVQNAWNVAIGDVVHFYFKELRGKPRVVGSFEIVDAKGHRYEVSIGSQVVGAALYNIDDPTFITEVDKDGAYEPDSKLGKYTGWLLSKSIGNTPPYKEEMFGRQQTLAPYPRP